MIARPDPSFPVGYQRKFAEYSAEEQSLKEALIVSNDQNNQNQQVGGVAIHRLGYTAKELYERALPDEKRLLLSAIFTNLIQDAYKITPNYTLAGKYLADWIPKLNPPSIGNHSSAMHRSHSVRRRRQTPP